MCVRGAAALASRLADQLIDLRQGSPLCLCLFRENERCLYQIKDASENLRTLCAPQSLGPADGAIEHSIPWQIPPIEPFLSQCLGYIPSRRTCSRHAIALLRARHARCNAQRTSSPPRQAWGWVDVEGRARWVHGSERNVGSSRPDVLGSVAV